MKQFVKLIVIGLCAGTILACVLILVYFLTNNEAYILLFNVDYMPILNRLHPKFIVEIAFHYGFCIASVVLLYQILHMIHREHHMLWYVVIYTSGSAVLFFLTALSSAPPVTTDIEAWSYWTIAHAIYGIIVGGLIRKWV